MKINLRVKTKVPLIANSDGYRSTTTRERVEINRILKFLEKAGSDPNVQDVQLKNDLTSQEILYFLSSGCPELVNFLGILLAYSNSTFSLNSEDRYSIILHLVDRYPQVFPVAMREFGLTIREDVSDVLQNIRVRVIYKRRPKRSQRHRGYRDKGNLPDQQSQLRRVLTFDEAAEEARYHCQHVRELSDTIDFIFGMIY